MPYTEDQLAPAIERVRVVHQRLRTERRTIRDLRRLGIGTDFLERLHENSCEALTQQRAQLRRLRAELLSRFRSHRG
jgi:hypothetical protein